MQQNKPACLFFLQLVLGRWKLERQRTLKDRQMRKKRHVLRKPSQRMKTVLQNRYIHGDQSTEYT